MPAISSVASRPPEPTWSKKIRVKQYPHFDAPISKQSACSYADNPSCVTSHNFYPFIQFEKSWKKFRVRDEEAEAKSRKIRYAARLDSIIYARYRAILSERYEHLLEEHGLGEAVVAYRRIPVKGGSGGKNNIHIAKEAFDCVKKLENGSVLCLDISKFFESLDHRKLKDKWIQCMGTLSLPPDHNAIFKSMTKYSFVDKIELYKRLEFFSDKKIVNGRVRPGFTVPFKDIPVKICSNVIFRQNIMGNLSSPGIIKTNKEKSGIPQGSSMSDILANLYMLDFDKYLLGLVSSLGGTYRRYSDDIMIVIPHKYAYAKIVHDHLVSKIKHYGSELQIKPSKSYIYEFNKKKTNLHIKKRFGEVDPGGIEFLGFRFDGRKIYLRNSTLSNLHRKISRASRMHARMIVKRYSDLTSSDLLKQINFEVLEKKFLRVEDFDKIGRSYRSWTFLTYVKKAETIFSKSDSGVQSQVRNTKNFIKDRIKYYLQAERSLYLRRFS